MRLFWIAMLAGLALLIGAAVSAPSQAAPSSQDFPTLGPVFTPPPALPTLVPLPPLPS